MIQNQLLLADDDSDDCLFFKEALEEIPASTTLQTVNDGVELMQYLSDNASQLPHALFLDLNMPRKDGIECLTEIKTNTKLQHLPVIIISTSLNMEVVNLLYQRGAQYYIQKPGNFSKLKNVILEALQRMQKTIHQPERADFVIA